MRDAEIDSEQEYRRLLRFMTREGPRFGLALARYRDGRVARELRERLVVEAAAKGCRAASLELGPSDREADLVARITSAVGRGQDRLDVLFVAGLDRVLLDELGRPVNAPSLSNLNQRRDRLPELVDARVVLWVADAAYAEYARQLRDLSEVMLTSARFAQRSEVFVEPGVSSTWPGWMALVEDAAREPMLEQAQRLARMHERASHSGTRGELAASIAGLYASLGTRDQMEEWALRAVDAFAEAGELTRACDEARRLASAREHWGDLDGALAMAARAVRLADKADNKVGRIRALSTQASILTARGELGPSLRLLRGVVLPGITRFGSESERAAVLATLAQLLSLRNDLEGAQHMLEEQVLPVFERLGDLRSRASAIGVLADILRRKGKLDESLRLTTEEELPAYEQLGDVYARAVAWGRAAGILHERGDLDESLRIRNEEVLPVFEGLVALRELAICQANIASTLADRAREGDLPRARELLREAISGAERLGLREKAEFEALLARLGDEPAQPM